jgi:hypothetical protein
VMAKAADMLRTAAQSMPAGSAQAGTSDMVNMMIDMLQNTLAQVNLLSLLAWGRLGMPSIAGLLPIDTSDRIVYQVADYGQMFLLQIVILGVGLLIACAFLSVLAQTLMNVRLTAEQWLRKVFTFWLYMVIIFVPLSLFFIFILSFSMILGPFGIFSVVLVLWLALYLSFVPQAIALGGQKPLSALASSFAVVRFGFWPTLALVALTNVISTGLGLIWQRLVGGSPITILVAIVANAYVGTALTVAMFIFFRNRIALLQQTLQSARKA